MNWINRNFRCVCCGRPGSWTFYYLPGTTIDRTRLPTKCLFCLGAELEASRPSGLPDPFTLPVAAD